MHRDIDISKILKANPQIDPRDLEEARKMLSKLRESGVKRSEYKLVPPFAGRRASVKEDAGKDRRAIRLRHSSERA